MLFTVRSCILIYSIISWMIFIAWKSIILQPLFPLEHLQTSILAGQKERDLKDLKKKKNAGVAMYLKLYQQFDNS